MPIDRVRISQLQRTPLSEQSNEANSGAKFYNDFTIRGGYLQSPGTKMYLEYLSVNSSAHNFQTSTSFEYTFPSLVPVTQAVNIGDVAVGYRNYTVRQLSGLLQAVMLEQGHCLLNAAGMPVYYAEFLADASTGLVAYMSYPLPTSLPVGWTNPGSWSFPASAGYTQITILADSPMHLRTGLVGVLPPSPAVPGGLPSYITRSTSWPDMDPYLIQSVRCSVVNDTRGGERAQEIHSYDFVGVGFGSQLQYRVQTPLRYDVLPGVVMRVRICDTRGRLIPLRDPNVNIVLAFEV